MDAACAWWQAVQSNWANEFAKWAPNLKAVLYDGTPDERKALRAEHVDPGGFNTLITHYDLALRDKTVLRKVRQVSACSKLGSRVALCHNKGVSVCLLLVLGCSIARPGRRPRGTQ